MSRPGRGAPAGAHSLRLLLVLLGSAVALVLAAGPASAHDALTATAPGNGSTVARTPASVVLTFDQPAIAMGSRVVVRGPAGEVQEGAPVLVDHTVTQALRRAAPAGAYVVEWRVTSADGHPISGTFTFTAREPGSSESPADAPTPAAVAGQPSSAWPWLIAVALLSFVVVAAVALGRRAVGEHESDS